MRREYSFHAEEKGKSQPIVKLSIKAESLHLGYITKQKRLQGVYVQLLKGTQQISENAPCRQAGRNDIQLTFTRTLFSVQSGAARGVLFAFSACSNARV